MVKSCTADWYYPMFSDEECCILSLLYFLCLPLTLLPFMVLPAQLFIHLCIYPVFSLYLSIYYPFIYPSIHLSIYLSIHPFIYSSIYPSILSILSIHLFYLSIYSISLFICMFVVSTLYASLLIYLYTTALLPPPRPMIAGSSSRARCTTSPSSWTSTRAA